MTTAGMEVSSGHQYDILLLAGCSSKISMHFKDFTKHILKESRRKVATLRTGNGTDYISFAFQDWLWNEGIRHEWSASYCPEQNGVAERENWAIVDSTRAMIYDKDLPQKLWTEVVNNTVYLQNRLARRRLIKTPFEIWRQVKPDVSHLEMFGIESFAHEPNEKRSNFDKKSVRCVFFCYSENQTA